MSKSMRLEEVRWQTLAKRRRTRIEQQLARLVGSPPRWGTPLALPSAVALVLALEASPVWSWVRDALASLEFDPARVDLLSAWLACFVLGLLAAALTGRVWVSALTAITVLALAYAVPSAWAALTAPPLVFGVPERVSLPALAGNLAAVLGLGGLLATIAAATGQLARQAVHDLVRDPASPSAEARVVALVLACLAAASGGAPLIRNGPATGVDIPQSTDRALSGQVLLRTYDSAAMGLARPYAIYLPPGYAGHPGQRYPVLYLLHGDPGGYQDWVSLGLPRLLDAGIARGLLPPVVAVMPDGNGKAYPASQWADSFDGRDRVEDSVLELVSVIDRTYRTESSRRYRVIAGLSEGGFGAVNLAARHPAVFETAMSLSGTFNAAGAVFGNDAPYLRANSPARILESPGPARTVDYLLVAGAQDPRYRAAVQTFAAELDRLGVRHQLFVIPGGHEGRVWTEGLVTCLQVLKAQLKPGGNPSPDVSSRAASRLPAGADSKSRV